MLIKGKDCEMHSRMNRKSYNKNIIYDYQIVGIVVPLCLNRIKEQINNSGSDLNHLYKSGEDGFKRKRSRIRLHHSSYCSQHII